ncbi:hypothetical protein [Pseudoxanthomonas mexicana]|uniref:hypothetical protein n=1 Tax=Pseudoxanthomonas mexicana TaxID=128785 RepID=UPI0012ED67C1|nr:hypothetical protein [Pseudoxanthomonas mexicana]
MHATTFRRGLKNRDSALNEGGYPIFRLQRALKPIRLIRNESRDSREMRRINGSLLKAELRAHL